MKIVWTGSFTDPTGYGQTSRLFARALAKETSLTLRNISFHGNPNTESVTGLSDKFTYTKDNSYDIHIQMLTPEMYTKVANAKYNIGYTMFETDRLPKHWSKRMKRMDYLITSSEQNREIFANYCKCPIENIIKVYPGIDTTQISKKDPNNIRKKYGIPTNKRVVLAVCDYNPRKGIYEILEAVNRNADKYHNIFYVLRFTPVYRTKEYIDYDLYQKLGNHKNVLVLTDIMDRQDINDLMNASDFLFTPTRGEGYGLPIVEAMAHSTIPVATNWSAQSEYLDKSFSYLMDYELKKITPIEYNRSLYFGHMWSVVPTEELDKAIEWISSLSESRMNKMKKKAKHTSKEHDVRKTTQDLLKGLRKLTRIS